MSIAWGIIIGWENDSLTPRAGSEAPPNQVNSAADRVVGTAITRIHRSASDGRVDGSARPPPLWPERAAASLMPCRRQSCITLEASTTDPPPTATSRAAPAAPAAAGPP